MSSNKASQGVAYRVKYKRFTYEVVFLTLFFLFSHHILVFLPGQDEILSTIAALKEVCAKDRDLELLPLYSALSYEAQMKAITKPKPGVRRIVFSTNIAETSLTIPGIRVVLDCGYVNRKYACGGLVSLFKLMCNA